MYFRRLLADHLIEDVLVFGITIYTPSPSPKNVNNGNDVNDGLLKCGMHIRF
jgi:hypothetical protein